MSYGSKVSSGCIEVKKVNWVYRGEGSTKLQNKPT